MLKHYWWFLLFVWMCACTERYVPQSPGRQAYSFQPQDIPTFEWSTVVVDVYLQPIFDLKCNLKVDTIDQLLPCRYDGINVYVDVPQYADGWMAYLMVKAPGFEVKVLRVRLLSNATGPSIYMTPENVAQ